jgi:hypothetical protein
LCVTVSVLSSVYPNVLGRYSKQTNYLHLRGRTSAALLSESTYTKGLIPPLVEEETPWDSKSILN